MSQWLHNVWNLLKMSFFNFAIFHHFFPMYWTSYWQVSTDKVSDNTFWPLHTVWKLPKMSHFNFGIFSHFPPLKMTTLVTLFQNGPFFSFLKQPFVHSKCKSSSLCSQITILNETFFFDFQTPWVFFINSFLSSVYAQ